MTEETWQRRAKIFWMDDGGDMAKASEDLLVGAEVEMCEAGVGRDSGGIDCTRKKAPARVEIASPRTAVTAAFRVDGVEAVAGTVGARIAAGIDRVAEQARARGAAGLGCSKTTAKASAKPVCIDLFCGLGGWSEAFIAEGYECIGYDIEAHDYGQGGYPGTLVLRDIRSIHGSEFKDAVIIVGSSPCQEFSYRGMPWKRAKALPPPYLGIELFNHQFRIQREASEAAGRHIPMVVENVCKAQKWVGRARWHYGSFYLWGDVPALMPISKAAHKFGGSWTEGRPSHTKDHSPKLDSIKNDGGSWFKIAHNTKSGSGNNPVCIKVSGLNWSRYGQPGYKAEGFNVTAAQRLKLDQDQLDSGNKGNWLERDTDGKRILKGQRATSSRGNSRKAASALIAKIPYPLAQHIARCYYPIPMAVVNG